MIHQKSVVSCCNQIWLDIEVGKESKSRLVHSIVKSFNQQYQAKRDNLQSIKNIQHSKLFLQSIVNPNSSYSFCNQEKEINKKLIKNEWNEPNQISFSELKSSPQIPFYSYKIFISYPPPPTFHSPNLSLRFKVFCGGFNHQMVVSNVHQIKSYQTFKALICSFREDDLFSTDEQQDEEVNEEEINHSMNCEKEDNDDDELLYFELGCYFPSFKLSGIGPHLIQITSTISKDALQSSSSSPSSSSYFISTSFFHPISNCDVINMSHLHQSSVLMSGGLLVDEEGENEKCDGYVKNHISHSNSIIFDHHIKSNQSSSSETRSTNNNHITRREIRSSEEYEMFYYLDLIISNLLSSGQEKRRRGEMGREISSIKSRSFSTI